MNDRSATAPLVLIVGGRIGIVVLVVMISLSLADENIRVRERS